MEEGLNRSNENNFESSKKNLNSQYLTLSQYNSNSVYNNLQVTEEYPEEVDLDFENENRQDNNKYDKDTLIEYIEKLENKIREQAARLSEAEKYRYLCEYTIKQMNPTQCFPITESNLCNIKSNYNSNTTSPATVPFSKYDLLQKKYMKLMSSFNQHSKESTKVSLVNMDFPDPEKIQNFDKLKEYYSSLHSLFKKQSNEKDEIIKILRKETISCEEQRNMIELLKQTIQSDLIKSGILLKYISVDGLIEFDRLRFELEKFRKENVLSQGIISNLKNENSELKYSNDALLKNKEKVRKSLEEGLDEMDKCKEQVKILEYEKKKLDQQIEILKGYNISMNKDNNDLTQKNSGLVNKVKEISQISENQNDLIMKRLNEYRLNFEKLSEDFESLLKEKTNLEIENSNLKNENRITSNTNIDKYNQNYRKLYEEMSIEFEEYKNTQKRISKNYQKQLKNSFDKSKEELVKEYLTLKKENNILNLNIETIDLSLQQKTNELNEMSKNYERKLIQFESELKTFKNINIEYNHKLTENEKLKNEIMFQKEKYEKDTANKNNEISILSEEVCHYKCENSNLKENSKDLKKLLNDKEDEMEEFKEKIKKSEEKLSKLLEKDMKNMQIKSHEIINLSYNNNQLASELEKCSKELNEKINLLEVEKDKLENLIRNIELERGNLDNKNKNMHKTLVDLEDKIKSLIYECEYKDSIINTITQDKNKLEIKNEEINKKLKNEIEIIQSLQEKYKILEEYKSETKIYLYSIQSTLRASILKVLNYINVKNENNDKYDNLRNSSDNSGNYDLVVDSLSSKSFSQYLIKILNEQLASTEFILKDSTLLQLTSEFIQLFSDQFENIYDKLIDYNSYNKEMKEKLIKVEIEFNELSQSNIKISEKESKLKHAINNFKDEETKNKQFMNDLISEIKLLKKEREENLDEIKKSKNSNFILNESYDKLNKENEILRQEIEISNASNSKLENKIRIITKDKKNNERLIQSVIKSYPSKEVAKYVTEILNINEYILKTETEKIKIEEKLFFLEKELIILSEDQMSKNIDLSNVIVSQRESLKNLLNDYDKRINEKKENTVYLENEILNLQDTVKSKYEQILKNENELKLLRSELQFTEYKHNQEKIKFSSNNTSSFNNQYKNYSQCNSNNQYINQYNNQHNEISCLESNLFTQNKSPECTNLLTEYETIELNQLDNKKTNITSNIFTQIEQDIKVNVRRENIDNLNQVLIRRNVSIK